MSTSLVVLGTYTDIDAFSFFFSQSAYEAFLCKEDMTTSLVVKVEEVHCKIGNKLFVFALDGT